MIMNPYWGPWIVASINRHVETSQYLSGIQLYFEGDEFPTPQTYARLGNGHWLEVRIDGPTWNPQAKTWKGFFEVNICASIVKSGGNSLYLPRSLAGKVEATFADFIDIYKYGPDDDPLNDGTYFDCIRRQPFRGTDKEIVTGYLGQIEPNVPIDQITTEAHYIFNREGDT